MKPDFLFNRVFPLPRFMASWAGLLCICIYPNVMIGVSGFLVGFLRRHLRQYLKHSIKRASFSISFLVCSVLPEQKYSARSHRH
jgi:hypothetical protein